METITIMVYTNQYRMIKEFLQFEKKMFRIKVEQETNLYPS